MTRETIADRYARRADDFLAAARAVADDRWAAPAPCEGWTARSIPLHIVETSRMFLGFIDLPLDGVPPVDDDPVAAAGAATAEVVRVLRDPELATKTFEGMLGTTSFESAADRFLSFDLVVHRWDLARAAGLADHQRLDADDVRSLTETAHAFPAEGMRGPKAFGPEVPVPDDADEQTKLLAFLGRRS
jgi:uncharacterized protein (TIGR03086 family)